MVGTLYNLVGRFNDVYYCCKAAVKFGERSTSVRPASPRHPTPAARTHEIPLSAPFEFAAILLLCRWEAPQLKSSELMHVLSMAFSNLPTCLHSVPVQLYINKNSSLARYCLYHKTRRGAL